MITAAEYARYSTDRQDEKSIEYQMGAIRQYATEHNIKIVASYVDEAKTGTNMDREGFLNLIEDAKLGKFQAVIIYDIMRGSRDVADWFGFRKAMMLYGIQVFVVTQPLGEVTDPNSFLVELVTVGMGHQTVLSTRQSSMAGVDTQAEKGKFLGGTPPLGYDIIDQEYVINEEEARVVRTIFKMYGDGKSYDQIINALNGATGKKGRPLGKNSISSIIRNERYIGTYTWNKRVVKIMRKWAGGKPSERCKRIEDRIPAIIDQETWDKVVNRLKNNTRNRLNKSKRRYLLSGLIECTCCGATYVGHTTVNKKGYEYSSYVCGNKYRTKTCNPKNIKLAEIEEFVISNLKEYLLTLNYKETAEYIASRINGASPDLSSEKSELEAIKTKIANGTSAILKGIDYPELQEELSRLRLRKGELEDIIHSASARKSKVSPEAIELLFNESIKALEEGNIEELIKWHVTKIYAHLDGSYDVEIGVYTVGCGRRI